MLAIALAACGLSGGSDDRPAAAPGAPNVILVVVDDATAEMITPQTMPATLRELSGDRGAGTTFTDFVMTSPLCCPSRANILTGQYGHNNNVLRNHYPALRRKSHILPTWLQQAGYETFHVGKYLNGFTKSLDEPTDIPKGWDGWFTILDNTYYRYRASDQGELRELGKAPGDYVTRVINRKSSAIVEDRVKSERPFYLQIDHYAPHVDAARDGSRCEDGATPDRKDRALVPEIPVPDKASRNEEDISDKPWFVRALPSLTPDRLAVAERNFQCAGASLRAVDRGVASLLETLRDTGQLDNTTIFFTSDNGFFFGEHRIPAKKEFAYEENLRMPLFARMPTSFADGKTPDRIGALAANIDLAPTILELADAAPCKSNGKCRAIDGRSLLPLLSGEESPNSWPQERTLLLELDQPVKGVQERARPCSYLGVRTSRHTLVQYRTAAERGGPCRDTNATELYDLKDDPEQLENGAGKRAYAAKEAKLRERMDRLEKCEGNLTQPDADESACE